MAPEFSDYYNGFGQGIKGISGHCTNGISEGKVGGNKEITDRRSLI